jgi:hypothetical protein
MGWMLVCLVQSGGNMSTRDAYLFYEAGQAVAAAHLDLKIRHISGNPARAASEIMVGRQGPKPRMILWLTGMAAEKKGVGRSDPLRRTRNRGRIRAQVESVISTMSGSRSHRLSEARNLLNQAQDRANAICAALYGGIEMLVAKLRANDLVSGEEVAAIVRAVKEKRAAAGEPGIEEGATGGTEVLGPIEDGAGSMPRLS